MSSDLATSVIRTVVPAVVGLLLAQAARAGFDIDEASLIVVLEAVFIGCYYAAVRALGKADARAEWLLGSPATPSYGGGGIQ